MCDSEKYRGERSRNTLWSGLAITVAAAIAGCGGDTEGQAHTTSLGARPPAVGASTSQAAHVDQLRVKALAAANESASPGPYGNAPPEYAIAQVLDYAEANYPAYFPGQKVTQSDGPYLYRYYPETSRYVGVALNVPPGAPQAEAGVYVLGGGFGSSPIYVGQLMNFITPKGVPSYGDTSKLASADWIHNQAGVYAGGNNLLQVDGVLYSYGYGVGFAKSIDKGKSWSSHYTNKQPLLLTRFGRRLLAITESFTYSSSSDDGITWSPGSRFPGLGPQLDGYVNSADCMFATTDQLFAFYGGGVINGFTMPVWVSDDGKVFRIASSAETTRLNTLIAAAKWKCSFYDPVFPNPLTELLGSTSGTKQFKVDYVANPHNSKGGRYWIYTLKVSSDGVNWQDSKTPDGFTPSTVYEVEPNVFMSLGAIESEYQFEPRALVALRSTDGGNSWGIAAGGGRSYLLFDGASLGSTTVLVGQNGGGQVSWDYGASWDSLSIPNAGSLWGITAAQGKFVAVGDAGAIVVSSDNGKTWRVVPSGTTDSIRAIAFGNGTFVAVAPQSGAVVTSTNGVDWVRQSSDLSAYAPLTAAPRLAFGGGAFVAVFRPNVCVGANCEAGGQGVFYTTDLGKTWKRSLFLASGSDIAFGNGKFIAVSGYYPANSYYSSVDSGRTWKLVTAAPNQQGWPASISYGNGIFVGAGYIRDTDTGSPSGVAFSVDDGATWQFSNIYGASYGDNRALYTGVRWITYGSSGIIAASPY